MTSTTGEILSAPGGAGSGGPGDAAAGLGRARREAPWWLLPLTVVAVLGAFSVYAGWVATTGTGGAPNTPYLSPFYSPAWLVGHVPYFTAGLALVVPVAFRGTCYYYRKAYHRSFFWDPPACAVRELRHRRYRGETGFPLVLNNLHRYAFYLAAVYIVILGYDAANAFSRDHHLYLGLGTVIMVVNVVLLAGYTFSCHSFRHLVGGGLDCYSCTRFGTARKGLWGVVSRLNGAHPTWAWWSLFSVWGIDVYIRMLNAGWFTDPHLFG